MNKYTVIVGAVVIFGISFASAKGLEKIYNLVKKEWDKKKR